MKHLSKGNQNGFSLIELIAVVFMIALLVLLLVPGIRAALRSERKAVCAQNLEHVGEAMALYSIDNANDIPPVYDYGPTLTTLVAPYLGGMKTTWMGPDAMYCPENEAQGCPPTNGWKITDTLYYKGWSGYFIGYLVNAGVHAFIASGYATKAVKRTQIIFPGKTVSLSDLATSVWPEGSSPPTSGLGSASYFNPSSYPNFFLGGPHGGWGNVLFLDGHVESLSAQEKASVMSLPGQTVPWW